MTCSRGLGPPRSNPLDFDPMRKDWNLAHFPAASCCGFVDPLFPSSHRAPSALSLPSRARITPRIPRGSRISESQQRANPVRRPRIADAPSAAPSAAPPLREHRDVSPFTTVADLLLHANLSAFLPRRLCSFRPCHLKATGLAKSDVLHQYRHYSRIIPFSKPQYRDLAQGCVQRLDVGSIPESNPGYIQSREAELQSPQHSHSTDARRSARRIKRDQQRRPTSV